jgi:hypothetical protein
MAVCAPARAADSTVEQFALKFRVAGRRRSKLVSNARFGLDLPVREGFEDNRDLAVCRKQGRAVTG